ncbi:MAG: mechanosensitive ion channel [Syntrophobacteraceae bacterium]|nr:mechanosensitive ion channel [Syntrophobacteraceae bacterium]
MKRGKNIKRWLAAFSILFISIFGLMTKASAVEDANWRNMLQYFQDTFRSTGESLQHFNSRLDAQSRGFDLELAKIEKRKGQLMLMYGASFDPDDLRIIVHGLAMLRAEAENRFQWFADAEHTLQFSVYKIAELKAELKSQISDPSAAEFKDALKRDLRDISTLESQLLLIRSKMQESRKTYASFMSRLDGAEKATRSKTATYWKVHYLKALPGLFSEELVKDVKTGAKRWRTESGLWWEMVSCHEEVAKTRELLLKISGLTLLLALIGSILTRNLRTSLFPRTGPAGLLVFWVLLSLWASITWFGAKAGFEISGLVMTTGEEVFSLVMLYVFILFGRRADAVAKASPQVVYPLWILNSLSLQLEVISVPYGLSLTAWIVSLALCFIYMKWKGQTGAGKWERYSHTAATYLPCVLIVIAVCGYLPLSFLIVSTVLYGWLSIYVCVNLLVGLNGFVKTKRDQDGFPIGILSIIGFPVIVIATVYINMRLFSLHLGGSEIFDRILSAELKWDAYRLNLRILTLIIVGFYITRVLALLVESMALRAAHLDAGITQVIQKTSKYLFWGFFFIAVLSLLGFNLMSLAVVAGGLSVGIGFGLQQIVNNFFSGLILLLGRSVQPGDTIQINEMLGDVKQITIRNTVVQTRDNATLFVPNSELITNKLINWSHRDRRVRLTVAVGVAYGSDTKKVRALLLQAARSVQGVLHAPAPEVLFSNFGASTLDFQLRFWIGNMDQDLLLLSHVRYEIDRLFRENDIEIAFPQSALHIQSAPALERLFVNRS